MAAITASPYQPPVDRPPPAFDEMYAMQYIEVWRMLQRLRVPEADLADAVHDVFVVVHQKLSDYDPQRPLLAWLYGIAYRIACEDRRRLRRTPLAQAEVELQDHGPTPDEAFAARQAQEQVLLALETLDIEKRAVFVMHDASGLAMPEVAAALGIPLNTAYSRLRLARERFAVAIRRDAARGKRK